MAAHFEPNENFDNFFSPIKSLILFWPNKNFEFIFQAHYENK
jgi:hypothetical protein